MISFDQNFNANGSENSLVLIFFQIMLDKIILIFLLPAAALAQASCNGYWQYGRDQNQLQGYLTIPHDAYAAEHRLKVILSIGTKLRNVST